MAETSNITSKESINEAIGGSNVGGGGGGLLAQTTYKYTVDIQEFHETTTNGYGSAGNPVFGEGDGNSVKYTKIGYAFREFQQEVENSCGRKYYSDYLSGYSLKLTATVFGNK